MSLTLQFELTKSDITEASRSFARSNNILTKLYYAGAITAALGFVFFIHDHSADSDSINFAALSLIAAGAFMGLAPIWSAHSIYQRSLAELDRALHPVTLSVDDSGITWTDRMITCQYRWPAFIQWRETRNLLILQRTKSHPGILIPKRSISSGNSLSDLRSLLQSSIGPSKGFPIRPNA